MHALCQGGRAPCGFGRSRGRSARPACWSRPRPLTSSTASSKAQLKCIGRARLRVAPPTVHWIPSIAPAPGRGRPPPDQVQLKHVDAPSAEAAQSMSPSCTPGGDGWTSWACTNRCWQTPAPRSGCPRDTPMRRAACRIRRYSPAVRHEADPQLHRRSTRPRVRATRFMAMAASSRVLGGVRGSAAAGSAPPAWRRPQEGWNGCSTTCAKTHVAPPATLSRIPPSVVINSSGRGRSVPYQVRAPS